MIRVLLDEDVDVRLRNEFGVGFEVETVEHRGWRGKRNGQLLTLASESFDLFVTLDRKLPSQQNLSQFDLAVIVLRPRKQGLDELKTLMSEVRRLATTMQAGTFVEVGGSD